MKKLILFVLVMFSISATSMTKTESVNNGTEYFQKYYKGNISPDKLPKVIIKHLEKNYPGYSIMISKRKGNGYYFVKIKYNGNKYRPYYRSLVFDQDGNAVKG